LRFLLGAAEAGFFPGVIYYLGLWFPAAERASAFALRERRPSPAWWASRCLALFSLDGFAGVAGWRWIFIAEGIPSVLGDRLFYLTDRPEGALADGRGRRFPVPASMLKRRRSQRAASRCAARCIRSSGASPRCTSR
jgi:MFS family permease